jgi:uncharacterized protein (DUF342 family)
MILPQNKNDGSIAITFGENDLEARADFTPPLGSGTPLSPGYVESVLEQLNIIYGVRREAIEEACLECNLKHKPLRGVCVARGDPPENEVGEYFELNPRLRETGAPAGKNGRIDYRAYSPFIIVKKDQPLAALRKRRPGKDGRDVHGAFLSHGILNPAGVTGGENTRTENGLIIAGIHGQMLEKAGVLSVHETLVVKGAVGYTTGNIVFPGDVIIEGPVSDGFKIYSGGSVTIKQTFDATDVIAKTDLAVAGGIIGRGRALVKAGGALRAKFIENCRVACRKSITVENEIVSSSVFTMESLEMGEKGIIVGGEIYAIHGIRAAAVGRKGAKYARLHCGIDFTAQQEMEKNNNALRILSAKLGKLREFMAAPVNQNTPPEKRAGMEELLRRLEEEQQKITARVTELMGLINVDREAPVEIRGEIQEGTLIEICGTALLVNEPLRNVRIRLDAPQGQLAAEPL